MCDHEPPLRKWECRRCGQLNSELDYTCQWCDPAQDRADYERDHERDHRKNDR